MLTISPNGVKLIQSFESFSSKAYLDSIGLATIGYGTTIYPDGRHVALGDTCTQEEATNYMMHDLQNFETAINHAIHNTPTQNQFDAMCSLCYNIGIANFRASSVLRNFNNNKLEDAQHSFLLWDKVHVHGVSEELKGLLRRRLAEAVLFGPLSHDVLVQRYALDV